MNPGTNSAIEEADGRMVPHIAKAADYGMERVVILSNDTDVVVLMIHYMNRFLSRGLKELWLRYGTGAKQRFIPIHSLCIKLGDIQHSILKAHILTGCDVTSKIGTKLAAVNSIKMGNTLIRFGENSFDGKRSAEVFLINVLDAKCNCNSFDELRYEMYRKRKVSFIKHIAKF